MIRSWMGIALLAGGWLLGLDYYEQASPWAYAATLLAAFCLLFDYGSAYASRPVKYNVALAGLLLFLPVLWFAPWPYRVAPLAIVVGLALRLVPWQARWFRALASAAVTMGAILLVQVATLQVYATITARNHDAPWPLTAAIARLCALLGVEAAHDGSLLVFSTMRQAHHLAVTWDVLIDPATLAFLVGGLAWITIQGARRNLLGRRWDAWIFTAGRFALVVAAWLPVRLLLLLALYFHRAQRSDGSLPLHVMNQFFSPWLLLGLLAVPALFAWRWVRLPADEAAIPPGTDAEQTPLKKPVSYWSGEDWSPAATCTAAAISCLLGAMAIALALQWEPVGTRKKGRVMFVERHSPWSPSDRSYDALSFGGDDEKGSSYNYNLAYNYLAQSYEMSRLKESDAIDDATLANCDVLVIKIPRVRYEPEEVQAVLKFVQAGGGLMLLGDHTNLESSGANMNDITRWLGFTFRDDVLYSSENVPNMEHYAAPRVPHPAIQHVPEFDFAVSCSIDPGYSQGRPVVAATGLWSMPGNYHYENYMPHAQHVPEMRFGSFIQAWSTHYGLGRVVAWGDSTIFSSFCLFQTGKAHVLLNLVEWLNHRGGDWAWWFLLLIGIAALGHGLWMMRDEAAVWLILLAGTSCGWTAGSAAAASMQSQGLRLPPKVHALPSVVIDRTTSQVPLATSDRNDDAQGRGFGLLEQWISRLGYTTQRAEGDDVFQGDAIVAICPSRPGSEQFRRRLVEYVYGGGRLLVIDAGQSEALATSNQILRPFGLSINYAENRKGDLLLTEAWPRLAVESAWEVVGGERIATFNGTRPVCSKVRYGKGLVMAVGFGNLFNDKNMGYDWTHVPDAVERTRYDALFALLRNLVMDEPIAMPSGSIHLPDAKFTLPTDRPGPRGAMPQPKPIIK